jgi:hypothetical protein
MIVLNWSASQGPWEREADKRVKGQVSPVSENTFRASPSDVDIDYLICFLLYQANKLLLE